MCLKHRNGSEKMKENKPSVGGQAVIEGVMMRNDDLYAVAVRKPDKEIIVEEMNHKSFTKRSKILGLPFIRGIVAFVESLVMGMKILTFSAEFFEVEGETEEESKFDRWINKVFGDKANDVFIMISVVLALLMSVGLFVILPLGLSHLMKPILPSDQWVNFADGIIRVAVLLTYIVLISKMKDIQRVFQYHGAEHKSIHCYESGLDLTVENAKKQTRLHKRCGTSFLLYIVVISVFVLTIINAQTLVQRLVVRLVMLPIIAGISYEVLKFLGRSESKVLDIFTKPGLLLQKLTTAEPDDGQLEVALTALKSVLKNTDEVKNEEEIKDPGIEDISSTPVA
jgi:uncharacterized protein YqhQ